MTRRSVTSRKLGKNERILRAAVATVLRDGKKLDGELCLTNRRLVFNGMDQKRWEWALSAIVSTKMNNTLIFYDGGIRLTFSDGTCEVFLLHDREEWVVEILSAQVGPSTPPQTREEKEHPPTYDRGAIRENLMRACNHSELRILAFELAVDLENLAGDTKEAKVRELIRYCERAGRLPALLSKCRNLHPNLAWPRA